MRGQDVRVGWRRRCAAGARNRVPGVIPTGLLPMRPAARPRPALRPRSRMTGGRSWLRPVRAPQPATHRRRGGPALSCNPTSLRSALAYNGYVCTQKRNRISITLAFGLPFCQWVTTKLMDFVPVSGPKRARHDLKVAILADFTDSGSLSHSTAGRAARRGRVPPPGRFTRLPSRGTENRRLAAARQNAASSSAIMLSFPARIACHSAPVCGSNRSLKNCPVVSLAW